MTESLKGEEDSRHQTECDVLSRLFTVIRENSSRMDGNLLNKQHGRRASHQTGGF